MREHAFALRAPLRQRTALLVRSCELPQQPVHLVALRGERGLRGEGMANPEAVAQHPRISDLPERTLAFGATERSGLAKPILAHDLAELLGGDRRLQSNIDGDLRRCTGRL